VTSIEQAHMPENRREIQDLFSEYLRWVCPRIHEEYGIVFDAESMVIRDLQKVDIYMPPLGFLLLASDDGRLAGCACTRTLGEGIAELKRMFVRPGFRKRGIGGALVKQTIEQLKERGYSLLRLDSAGFMSDAHALYRSFGFRDIPPYEGSEIPTEYRTHWVFMELPLGSA
jgi:GNAT superfamily N-acetyltransferase